MKRATMLTRRSVYFIFFLEVIMNLASADEMCGPMKSVSAFIAQFRKLDRYIIAS